MQTRIRERFKTVSCVFQPTIIRFEYHNIIKKSEAKKKMKNWKILTVTAVTVVAALLLVSNVAAYCGSLGSGSYGYGGMMGRAPYYNTPTQPGATAAVTPAVPYQGYQAIYPSQFGGCMGRFGWNGGNNYATPPYTYTGSQLNITTATTIAKDYLTAINNPDLAVKQIEEYTANYYVQVNEKSTGNGAFELLINKYTGSIYPEMGPNMMWNTKYGMMRGGILGGIWGTPTATMTVTATQATENGQQYLNSYISGATTGDVTTFYGYYTIEVLNGGTTYGMLSVNGYTGQVWFHTWHGTLIQELQVS
jgi:hypothetical protein